MWDKPIGLLVDHIDSTSRMLKAGIETDSVSQYLVLILGKNRFILFEVPKFYRRINVK